MAELNRKPHFRVENPLRDEARFERLVKLNEHRKTRTKILTVVIVENL
jgi:hypothetical protein